VSVLLIGVAAYLAFGLVIIVTVLGTACSASRQKRRWLTLVPPPEVKRRGAA
jgi:hypothetical protein